MLVHKLCLQQAMETLALYISGYLKDIHMHIMYFQVSESEEVISKIFSKNQNCASKDFFSNCLFYRYIFKNSYFQNHSSDIFPLTFVYFECAPNHPALLSPTCKRDFFTRKHYFLQSAILVRNGVCCVLFGHQTLSSLLNVFFITE